MEENFNHVPVLLNECIEGLNIKPDGVYVEFWHDYKTAANLKKYCDRTAAKNGTTVVSINYRIAGEKLK